jgi:hypothetical protein
MQFFVCVKAGGTYSTNLLQRVNLCNIGADKKPLFQFPIKQSTITRGRHLDILDMVWFNLIANLIYFILTYIYCIHLIEVIVWL